MPATGRYLPKEAIDELQNLLEALRINDRFADAKHGEYWTVYAHPVPQEEGGGISALVSIRPKSPQAENRAAGLRLMLKGTAQVPRLSAPANRRGQVWFWALDPGDYSACAVERDLRQLVSPQEAALVMVAAPACTSCRIMLTESRVRVTLEESPINQRATLTVSTQAPELRGATVRFTFGGESGEMVLADSGIPGLWRDTKDLKQTFGDALKCQQAFEVIPAGVRDADLRPDA
jgi:hypothetical protein